MNTKIERGAATITGDVVLHTAELARLDLTALNPFEIHELTGQLGAILSYVAQLDGLDTTGVKPTTHAVPLEIPLRADQPTPIAERLGFEDIMRNAPKVDAGYFVVPRVIAES